MKEVKSFTFKVAKATESSKGQLKAREGVAIAGCSMIHLPSGWEPMYRDGSRDTGTYC